MWRFVGQDSAGCRKSFNRSPSCDECTSCCASWSPSGKSNGLKTWYRQSLEDRRPLYRKGCGTVEDGRMSGTERTHGRLRHALSVAVDAEHNSIFSDDFVEYQSPKYSKNKRCRVSEKDMAMYLSCIVCDAKNVDESHVDMCLDATCPSSPTRGNQTPESCKMDLPSIERFLGPSLQHYASALRSSNISSVDDLANLGDELENFLRQECQIRALGAVKKISLRVRTFVPRSSKTGTDGSLLRRNHQVTPRSSARENIVVNKRGTAQPPNTEKVWDIFAANYRVAETSKGAVKRPRKRRGDSSDCEIALHHPLAKRVPGTSFVVDSFRAAGCDSCLRYFLTHFHSDHYQTLRKSTLPANARVLCSAVTASLVRSVLRVPEDRIQTLPNDGNTGFDIEDTAEAGNGATVFLFDANHCPGAVMILFYVWKTKRYCLHTGDCRFDAAVFERHQLLSKLIAHRHLDFLYLDTTYANPRYTFPSQEKVLRSVVEAAVKEDERTRHRCVYFFGTYSIGKEKVFLAVAEAMNLHIYTDKRKRGLLSQLGFGSRLDSRLVASPEQARIHVVSMLGLCPDGLRAYCKRVGMNRSFVGSGLAVVFRPTGWTFQNEKNRSLARAVRGADQAVTYNVAYSEHSSFLELKQFVAWARPSRLIPTVNVKCARDVAKLRVLLEHDERDLRPVK